MEIMLPSSLLTAWRTWWTTTCCTRCTNLKMTQIFPKGAEEYQPQGKCFWKSRSQLHKFGQCRGGCAHTPPCRQSARWCWAQQSPHSLLILLVYQSPQSLWGSQWNGQSRHKDETVIYEPFATICLISINVHYTPRHYTLAMFFEKQFESIFCMLVTYGIFG